MNFLPKSLRTMLPHAAGLALALTLHAEPAMPETPADVKAPPADAVKTASGLFSKVLQAGKGAKKPAAADTVTVHYSGWMTDGKLFDSSVQRGQPTSFPLNGVIPGWTEGLQLMVEGEKRRFWIPPNLAYGDNPGSGGPSGMLVFDVELISIKEGPKPPPAPDDVAKVPDSAETTASGLATRILTKGTGTDHPAATDQVTVHYSGWTTDGKLFDSSVMRGQPATFPLNGVIKGWTEGVQLMTAGEKRRFWIPGNLAYGDKPADGRPGGMLVFDVELLSIKATPKPPPAPEDVAKAPDTAEKTASGLVSRVLTQGTGTVHPQATDQVKVHYSGWMTNGQLFDSSVMRGQPATFQLNGVIKGWTEGVQLMVEGEKRRFWIPGNLAYGDNPAGGRPGGTLVFDVELLQIIK
jgi:FKBP-type peptidyl-prolyl cis-trans isomerase